MSTFGEATVKGLGAEEAHEAGLVVLDHVGAFSRLRQVDCLIATWAFLSSSKLACQLPEVTGAAGDGEYLVAWGWSLVG